jgi:oligopeptide transport system substrate-binding protein
MNPYLLFLCTVFLLISCGKDRYSNDNQSVFNMNLPTGLSSLDPAYARDQANTWLTDQIFEGLVQLDTSLQIIPSIAHAWEIQDSGKVYIFYLKQNVFFHPDAAFGKDSTRKVTAHDFVYSFNRICDPATGSSGQWIFNGKVKGTEIPGELRGFKALNDSILEIHLSKPFPPFLTLLSMPYAKVVPKEAIQAYGRNFRSHPVGTGPFRFKSWKEGQSLILLKNPEYHESQNGVPLPYLDAVNISFTAGALISFHQFIRGELDFINRPDLSLKDEILDSRGELKSNWKDQFRIESMPQLNTEYLGMLMQGEGRNLMLKDKRIRQAMNYAIDRDQLVHYVLNGMGYAAHGGMVPPGMPGFDTTRLMGYRYNPEKALSLLSAAGYPMGKGLPEFILYTNPSYQPIMEFVQYQLAQIGIRVKLDPSDGASMREMIYQGRIPFWRASWIADYPDPENYMSLFYGPNTAPDGPNTTRFSQPEFDALYASASDETDPIRRMEMFRQMQQIIIDEAPVILLYYDKIIRLVRNEISGLETNAMNSLILKRVRKEIKKQ